MLPVMTPAGSCVNAYLLPELEVMAAGCHERKCDSNGTLWQRQEASYVAYSSALQANDSKYEPAAIWSSSSDTEHKARLWMMH